MPAETKIQTQAEVEEKMVDLPNSGSDVEVEISDTKKTINPEECLRIPEFPSWSGASCRQFISWQKYTCRNADGFGKITMFSDTIPYAWRTNNSGITACCTHAGSSSRVAT